MRSGNCIVIPVYKNELSQNEEIALESVKRFFPIKEDVYLIAPERLLSMKYEKYGFHVIYLEDKWFKDVNSYSKLMLNKAFYARKEFEKYRSMIICQTDVLLLKGWSEEIEDIVRKYDYIGAPWPGGVTIWSRAFKGLSIVKNFFASCRCYVGNGGLSSRNIEKTISLLNRYNWTARNWNAGEDCFFAYYGINNDIGFTVAPETDAAKFALEKDSKKRIRNGEIPWGIHAWEIFYKEIIEEYEDFVLWNSGSRDN